MSGMYFEDFSLEDHFVTEKRTITETDIVNFVNLTGLHTPLFVNMEYVRQETVFKERIAPGALVLSIAIAQWAKMGLLHGTSLAMLGLQVKFTSPVKPGDTIGSEISVVSKHESTKQDRGAVEFKYAVKNQEDVVVAELTETVLLKRKG